MSDGNPTRGEIWRVSLDPTIGSEIRKQRPCLVISSAAYDRLAIRIVVPFTSWQEQFSLHPNRVMVTASPQNGLTNDSAADTLQLRAVSIKRFDVHLGTLEPRDVSRIVMRIGQLIEYRSTSRSG